MRHIVTVVGCTHGDQVFNPLDGLGVVDLERLHCDFAEDEHFGRAAGVSGVDLHVQPERDGCCLSQLQIIGNADLSLGSLKLEAFFDGDQRIDSRFLVGL